jgi:lipopolysaccharide export system permease protein
MAALARAIAGSIEPQMKAALSPTLALYIGGRFLVWVAGVSIVLSGIILLADSIELLRRASGNNAPDLRIVVVMALFKLPSTAQEVMPFGLLAATLGCLTQLTRTSELIIVRVSGASIWQVLTPALLLGLAIGLLRIGAFDPLAAAATVHFERMERRYIDNADPLVIASPTGIWLRQATTKDSYVLHARSMAGNRPIFTGVTLLSFDSSDRFLERIDAETAELKDAAWVLKQVQIIQPNKPPQRAAGVSVPAKLTFQQLLESFASARTLSFWQLPGFITVLEASGLPSRAHRLKFQALLATPLLFVGIILLAATFALRLPRFGGLPIAIGAGAMSGFLLYFLSSLAAALGLNSSIPLVLAAWGPAVITAILGITLLLYVEDG